MRSSLLIIVGDPQVLSPDLLWKVFLNYIYLNGGWVRVEVDEAGRYDKQVHDNAQIDMEEFGRRMEAVTMDGVDELDANVVRPWTPEDE